MLDNFFGSYIIIINNNTAITSWIEEILKSQKFNQRSTEFRNRIINISHDFHSGDAISIGDIPIEKNKFVLNGSFFLTPSIPGKPKKPKNLKIKTNDYHEEDLFKLLVHHGNVTSHLVFFVSGEYSKKIKIMLGLTRELLPNVTIIAQCDEIKDVDICLSLGANYAHSIHDSNSYLLFGKLLNSFMIDFITEIIDDVRIEQDEPLIFDIPCNTQNTLEIHIPTLLDNAKKYYIEIISLYCANNDKYLPIPKSGKLKLCSGDNHLICWGYNESSIIEFIEMFNSSNF